MKINMKRNLVLMTSVFLVILMIINVLAFNWPWQATGKSASNNTYGPFKFKVNSPYPMFIEINSVNYSITTLWVNSDKKTAKFGINGEEATISRGQTITLGGLEMYVQQISYTKKATSRYVIVKEVRKVELQEIQTLFEPAWCNGADINKDSVVDEMDKNIVNAQMGKKCSIGTEAQDELILSELQDACNVKTACNKYQSDNCCPSPCSEETDYNCFLVHNNIVTGSVITGMDAGVPDINLYQNDLKGRVIEIVRKEGQATNLGNGQAGHMQTQNDVTVTVSDSGDDIIISFTNRVIGSTGGNINLILLKEKPSQQEIGAARIEALTATPQTASGERELLVGTPGESSSTVIFGGNRDSFVNSDGSRSDNLGGRAQKLAGDALNKGLVDFLGSN